MPICKVNERQFSWSTSVSDDYPLLAKPYPSPVMCEVVRITGEEGFDVVLRVLDHGTRIVIEVDGKHHYAEGNDASPGLYARMAAEDRKLRLQGYEVYRFGAAEFSDVERSGRGWKVGPMAEQLAIDFFTRLFEKHPPVSRIHSA